MQDHREIRVAQERVHAHEAVVLGSALAGDVVALGRKVTHARLVVSTVHGVDADVVPGSRLVRLGRPRSLLVISRISNDHRVIRIGSSGDKAAVLPLSKKLGDKATEIYEELSKYFMVDYDETGSIGKRYRRQDEIGTPLCITVDFETVGDGEKAADNCVTVRDRDTMEQVRLPISELKNYIENKIQF